jgi:hypothetical protein
MAILRVARPQGRRPEAIFYPFGHPTPYAYAMGATAPMLTNTSES